jgi:hypothetical protein
MDIYGLIARSRERVVSPKILIEGVVSRTLPIHHRVRLVDDESFRSSVEIDRPNVVDPTRQLGAD